MAHANYRLLLNGRHVASWAKTDMPIQSPHVCCWGMNEPDWDVARGLEMTLSGQESHTILNLGIPPTLPPRYVLRLIRSRSKLD